MNTMTKNILIASTLIGSISFAVANDKIGVVDYVKVYNQAPQGKASVEKALNKMKPKVESLTKEQDGLRKEAEALQKNQSVMSKKDIDKQQQAILTKQQDFQAQVMELREEENSTEQNLASVFQDKIQEAMNNVGKEGNYDFLFNSQAVPYSKNTENSDVTIDVIKYMKSN